MYLYVCIYTNRMSFIKYMNQFKELFFFSFLSYSKEGRSTVYKINPSSKHYRGAYTWENQKANYCFTLLSICYLYKLFSLSTKFFHSLITKQVLIKPLLASKLKSEKFHFSHQVFLFSKTIKNNQTKWSEWTNSYNSKVKINFFVIAFNFFNKNLKVLKF